VTPVAEFRLLAGAGGERIAAVLGSLGGSLQDAASAVHRGAKHFVHAHGQPPWKVRGREQSSLGDFERIRRFTQERPDSALDQDRYSV